MIRYFCVRAPLFLTLSTLFFIHNKTAFIFNLCVDHFLRIIAFCDSNEIRFKEKSIFFDNFRNGTPSKNDCRMNSTIKKIETDFSGLILSSIFDKIYKFDLWVRSCPMQSLRVSGIVYLKWLALSLANLSFPSRRGFSEDVDPFCCIRDNLMAGFLEFSIFSLENFKLGSEIRIISNKPNL